MSTCATSIDEFVLTIFSLTRDYDYHKFESQNYGTLWHFLLAMVLLIFITVAKVR